MKKTLITIFVTIVALDQVTKAAISSGFSMHESRVVIPGFFSLTYVLNPGAAFGFLARLNESYRQIFFVAVTIIAIAAVAYLLTKEFQMKLRAYSYTLILSGAIGNLIDRIYIGKVVDFLDFYVSNHHWPAFNMADSAITIGISLLMLDLFLHRKERK
jgi:signal peptidase II